LHRQTIERRSRIRLTRPTPTPDKTLDDENTRKRLLELGSDLPSKQRRGPGPLGALVKGEIARWTPIITAAGPLN
jgi:hypothetical protein